MVRRQPWTRAVRPVPILPMMTRIPAALPRSALGVPSRRVTKVLVLRACSPLLVLWAEKMCAARKHSERASSALRLADRSEVGMVRHVTCMPPTLTSTLQLKRSRSMVGRTIVTFIPLGLWIIRRSLPMTRVFTSPREVATPSSSPLRASLRRLGRCSLEKWGSCSYVGECARGHCLGNSLLVRPYLLRRVRHCKTLSSLGSVLRRRRRCSPLLGCRRVVRSCVGLGGLSWKRACLEKGRLGSGVGCMLRRGAVRSCWVGVWWGCLRMELGGTSSLRSGRSFVVFPWIRCRSW